jgi:hypothetical protein
MSEAIMAPIKHAKRRMTILAVLAALAYAAYLALRMFG